jgi:hypothetical protein
MKKVPLIQPDVSDSTPKCANCEVYENTIEALVTRITSLEEIVHRQSQALSSLNRKFDDYSLSSRKESEEFFRKCDQSLCQKFSSIMKSKDSYASKLASSNDTIPQREVTNSINTSSQIKLFQRRHSGSFSQSCLPSSEKITVNAHSDNASSARVQKNFAKNVNFEPSKCLVIHDLCTAEIQNINQDVVRGVISDNFGPMIIDFVSKYKFSSNSPKFIVQFADVKNVDMVLNGWSSSFFGGSKARKTIKPTSYAAYIKGVPLELSDEKILGDIRKHYDCTSIYRLKSISDGKPLRTVKLNFVDQNNLDRALKDKIVFPSFYNLMVSVNLPFSIASNYHHG